MKPALYITRQFEKSGMQCQMVCASLMFLKETYRTTSKVPFQVADEMYTFEARKDRLFSDTLYGQLTKPVKQFVKIFATQLQLRHFSKAFQPCHVAGVAFNPFTSISRVFGKFKHLETRGQAVYNRILRTISKAYEAEEEPTKKSPEKCQL